LLLDPEAALALDVPARLAIAEWRARVSGRAAGEVWTKNAESSAAGAQDRRT